MMASKITKLPFFGRTDKTNVTTFEIETNVPGPPPEIKSDVVPLWIILLSAIVGTLILLLAVLLLYKVSQNRDIFTLCIRNHDFLPMYPKNSWRMKLLEIIQMGTYLSLSHT